MAKVTTDSPKNGIKDAAVCLPTTNGYCAPTCHHVSWDADGYHSGMTEPMGLADDTPNSVENGVRNVDVILSVLYGYVVLVLAEEFVLVTDVMMGVLEDVDEELVVFSELVVLATLVVV